MFRNVTVKNYLLQPFKTVQGFGSTSICHNKMIIIVYNGDYFMNFLLHLFLSCLVVLGACGNVFASDSVCPTIDHNLSPAVQEKIAAWMEAEAKKLNGLSGLGYDLGCCLLHFDERYRFAGVYLGLDPKKPEALGEIAKDLLWLFNNDLLGHVYWVQGRIYMLAELETYIDGLLVATTGSPESIQCASEMQNHLLTFWRDLKKRNLKNGSRAAELTERFDVLMESMVSDFYCDIIVKHASGADGVLILQQVKVAMRYMRHFLCVYMGYVQTETFKTTACAMLETYIEADRAILSKDGALHCPHVETGFPWCEACASRISASDLSARLMTACIEFGNGIHVHVIQAGRAGLREEINVQKKFLEAL